MVAVVALVALLAEVAKAALLAEVAVSPAADLAADLTARVLGRVDVDIRHPVRDRGAQLVDVAGFDPLGGGSRDVIRRDRSGHFSRGRAGGLGGCSTAAEEGSDATG